MNNQHTNNNPARGAGQPVVTALIVYRSGKTELYGIDTFNLVLRRANANGAIKFVREHSTAITIGAIYLVQSNLADVAESEVKHFLYQAAMKKNW